MKRVFSLFVLLTLALVAAACQQQTPTPTPSTGTRKPTVIITTPPSNASVQTGDEVKIQSVSASSDGIVLVELMVDGQSVQNSPTPNGTPQQQFSVIQNWNAGTIGSHTVTVKATD